MTRPLSPNYYCAGQERESQRLYILQKKKEKEGERERERESITEKK